MRQAIQSQDDLNLLTVDCRVNGSIKTKMQLGAKEIGIKHCKHIHRKTPYPAQKVMKSGMVEMWAHRNKLIFLCRVVNGPTNTGRKLISDLKPNSGLKKPES